MYNYVLYEDNVFYNKEILKVINKIKNDKDNIYNFFDYDHHFISKLNQKWENLICIIDIEMPSKSGIDLAYELRSKNPNCILIFITAHENEYSKIILKSKFANFYFVSKSDINYLTDLEDKIKDAISKIGTNYFLELVDQKIKYTIPYDDILYITTDKNKHKSIIITSYAEIRINKTLKYLLSILPKQFSKTHRSCLTNMNNVFNINTTDRLITFNNGSHTSLITQDYIKKEI